MTGANGVVYCCTTNPDDAQGHMYALNAATGAVLWHFASDGSCLSGAAVSNGTVFWGSGYAKWDLGTPGHTLYAFELS